MNDAQKRFVFEHPLAMLCWERLVMFSGTSAHIRLSESNKWSTARLWVIKIPHMLHMHDAAY